MELGEVKEQMEPLVKASHALGSRVVVGVVVVVVVVVVDVVVGADVVAGGVGVVVF